MVIRLDKHFNLMISKSQINILFWKLMNTNIWCIMFHETKYCIAALVIFYWAFILTKIHLRRSFRCGFIFLLAFYVVKSCPILFKCYILFSTRTDILLETYFKVWAKFDNFLLHKSLTKIWSHSAKKRKGLLKWILTKICIMTTHNDSNSAT